MTIRLLSPEVVSQIAAGEVVERPASVVKELVENALDAGATQITVEANGGGASLIRISDNGSGIAAAEVELAFERHATSKISTLADLENTTSLGFRGEALPSIAAVSRMELLTRAAADTAGTYVVLADGKVVENGARASASGTAVTVRHLFRNVPARLKFLKSQTTENGHIADLVTRYCLSFPEVRFTLTIEGRSVLRTPGNGKLRDVIVQVYGLDVAAALLDVAHQVGAAGSGIRITGCISPPSVNRVGRGYLSFFVNRRWVTSPAMGAALEKAYQGQLPPGRYPFALLNIALPPREIDVNVHPTKRAVKFHQEQTVFAAVYQAVSQALAQPGAIPEARLPSPSVTASAPPPARAGSLWKPGEVMTAPPSPATAPDSSGKTIPILRVLGQLAAMYIIAEGPDGLYLIDQHAAHERVLFETILAQRAAEGVRVQGLLEAVPIELSPRQNELWESRKEMLARFGFSLEPFGERTYLLRAVPAMARQELAVQLVKEVLDSLAEGAAPERERAIAASLACHSAVRAGQALGLEELRSLVRQLESAESPYSCPHGRPTMVHLSSGQLQREFGRA